MFIVGKIMENIAENLFEFFFVVRMHVTTHMLSFIFQLPFKTRIFLPTSLDHKDNRVHIQMDRQLISLTFLAVKVQDELFIVPAESYCTIN